MKASIAKLQQRALRRLVGEGLDKAYILREIERTAAANGGQPPGQQRFLAETGIRVSDWKGVFWARWGDALTEAGFAPNKLTEAYSETHILECYALLTMELRRLPTDQELRLKRRNDSSFPDSSCFRRFGSKSELLRRLHDYCRCDQRFAEVVHWCEHYKPPRESTPRAQAPGSDLGCVYLLKSGKFYKIGRTNAAGRREYELSIQLPERAATVHVIRTDDPVGIEEYWHKRFDAKRKNGEWFSLDASDIAAFRRRKFM